MTRYLLSAIYNIARLACVIRRRKMKRLRARILEETISRIRIASSRSIMLAEVARAMRSSCLRFGSIVPCPRNRRACYAFILYTLSHVPHAEQHRGSARCLLCIPHLCCLFSLISFPHACRRGSGTVTGRSISPFSHGSHVAMHEIACATWDSKMSPKFSRLAAAACSIRNEAIPRGIRDTALRISNYAFFALFLRFFR